MIKKQDTFESFLNIKKEETLDQDYFNLKNFPSFSFKDQKSFNIYELQSFMHDPLKENTQLKQEPKVYGFKKPSKELKKEETAGKPIKSIDMDKKNCKIKSDKESFS